ncbi:hypothetical protein G7Y79_00014g037310 [Physcia stellaris]|nr:hypothetical protein G7Y79_00014g037310 [Physcia stellaris]
MSGIEIAGIALAVFPVLVSGLSRFAEGARTIKYWRRCRARLEDYADDIKSQETYYLDTIDELFIGITTSEDDLARLMSAPKSFAKARPEYDQQLRRRLGRSYDEYVRSVTNMVKTLGLLREKLGIERSGKVVSDEYSFMRWEMKRLKLALLRDSYKDLLETTEKANSHVASLRLEPRAQGLEPDDTSLFRFNMVLSTKQNPRHVPAVSSWQEVEVRPKLERQVVLNPLPSDGGPKKGVRFDTDSLTSPMAAASLSQIGTSKSPEAIADLCTLFRKSSSSHDTIGFLMDEKDESHKHYLYWTRPKISVQNHPRSLDDVFTSANTGASPLSLSRIERLEVSVTLASSVLQLYGTSWLSSDWTSRDILLHFEPIHGSDPSYMYPYLSWRQCLPEGDSSPDIQPRTKSNHFIRSEILFALGLTLVELCFGKTLQSMGTAEDVDPDNVVARTNTAFRLLDSLYKEMSDSYEAVVRKCLRQPFDVRDLNLDNEDVQQEIYDTIITPLIDEYINATGQSRIR